MIRELEKWDDADWFLDEDTNTLTDRVTETTVPLCSKFRLRPDYRDDRWAVMYYPPMSFGCILENCENRIVLDDFSESEGGVTSRVAVCCRARNLVWYVEDIREDSADLADEFV